jgi:hypothetical protein
MLRDGVADGPGATPARRRGQSRPRRAGEGAIPATATPAFQPSGPHAISETSPGDAGAGDGRRPVEGGRDAAELDALLLRLSAASTRSELAAIGAPDAESRTAHAFTAEIARALHLLLSSGAAAEGHAGVSTLRRVARMADWLAERARSESAVRGGCDLAAEVAATLRAAPRARRPAPA